MTNRNTDAPQGEGGNGGAVPPTPQPQTQTQTQPQGVNDNLFSRGNTKVYKSGPLFLSSKGIGWTSWKKRWFILTRTSLVFYRSDPNAVPQKGSEVNLTLGGIDLNSSGSVVVKEDKKLLTVLFPDGRDGRDGRAFTLKAETSEDLHEWKAALEEALANAPSAALVMGQNGLFRNDQGNAADASSEQVKDRQPVKSLVIGRPILLALEDIDGTPSFLEKSLKFVEEHGVKVEGILRQAADVDDVERRIREYEQGKCEFSPEEDAHVIADCVKYILRELPSSPVPASCCNALLEAYRTDRSTRVNAMRIAICETFPEPNRRLLQRILMMMQKVASHKVENRMSVSAVAACMAPLLLRPLLAGDCELEHGFDMGGDSSVQLLQAAAAANHAQAICITLLEEYNSLFGEGSASPEPYTDSEESGSETEELTDDDDDDDDENYEDDEDDYTTEGSDADVEEDDDHASNATSCGIDETIVIDKGSECSDYGLNSGEVEDVHEPGRKSSPISAKSSGSKDIPDQCDEAINVGADDTGSVLLVADPAETSTFDKSSSKFSNGPAQSVRRATAWGRAPARKNLSMESIDLDLSLEDEDEILRLEAAKADLQNRITEEAKGNSILQSSLEKRKNALRERRLALERDVARLQEQLQKERELRAALEAGLRTCQGQLAVSSTIDEKMKAEIEEIAQAEVEVSSLKQKADDLGLQLNQQREQNSRLHLEVGNHLQKCPSDKAKRKDKQKTVGTASTPHAREKSTRSKCDNRVDKADSDKAKKQESSFPTDDNPLLNQQMDQVQNQKSVGLLETTPSVEQAAMKPPASSNSKKSSSRTEGTNSTSSALSKLTNRLNFLKERRTQIANELHSMDKSRSSSQPVQNPEKGKGSEARHQMDKLQGSEGQSLQNNKGLDSHHQSLQSSSGQSDKGRRPDAHPNLDRGKSDSFPPVDKGRSMGPSRTNSR